MKLVLSVIIILALVYNLRKYWSIKCFYCRIDYLDAKYGPSETAELWKRQRGQYNRPPLNNRERKVKR